MNMIGTEKIWIKFKDELLGFIILKVKDKEIAQDILQEVFIKIHLKLSSISEKDKLSSWIYQIARNTIIDYYRKNKKTEIVDELRIDIDENEQFHNKELLNCLKPFIENLPDKYQDSLLKTTYGALSQKEYAQQLNINYSAAKSRIQRARKYLKEAFVKCCAIESDKYGNILEVNKKNCGCD